MANQINNVQMPVADQAAAERAGTASRARMQSNLAMSAGAAMSGGPAVAQKAAGVAATEQGQIAAQASSAQVAKTVTQAQTELHSAELRAREQQTIHAESMAVRHTALKTKMEALGRDIKQKLFDEQLAFDKTQREARFATQRQLQDFLTLKAVDHQAMQDYQQSVEAAIQRDIQMMQSAYKTLAQAELQSATDTNRALDQESRERIKRAKEVIDARIKKASRRAGIQKRNMGLVKTAAGAGLMFAPVPGGQAAGAALMVSGGEDAVQGQQQAKS